ncbi:MAG: hypothetical protein Q9165_005078 [Trypethelium subeluteriae]
MSLKAERRLSLKSGNYDVNVTLTHNPGTSSQSITFKDPIFEWGCDGVSFSLFRIEEDGYVFIENNDAGHGNPFNPYWDPLPSDTVNVAQGEDFVELKPGESYSRDLNLYPDSDFVERFEVGKKYSYRFLGEPLEWWAWGRKEDFRNKPVLMKSIGRGFSPEPRHTSLQLHRAGGMRINVPRLASVPRYFYAKKRLAGSSG